MNVAIRKASLVGIPVLALVISLLFFGDECPVFTLQFTIGYFICLFITAVLWIGNSEIFAFFHHRWPQLNDTGKRTTAIVLACLVYTVVGFTLAIFLVKWLMNKPIYWNKYWFDLKIALLFTTLIVLVYEVIFFYKQWQTSSLDAERLRKENTLAQLDSLRNQVNPHFLFNSLNTLVSIIPDCPDTAIDFTQKLSNVYRYLLSMRDKELVDLKTELDFINSYLFLLNVRFADSLKIEMNMQEGILSLLLPPVSLQMLIENAIKHNVVSREKPLHISIYSENGYLMVKNNIQPKQQKEESTGIGLENIRKRYAILSDKNIEVLHTSFNFTVALPLLVL